jgi:nucleoside-diphosphate-sugar epimerase
MEQTSILVTGGCGYIGSLLVPRLLQKGYNVTVVDALLYGDISHFFPHFVNPAFRFVRGDIRDKELMMKLVDGKDFIIHLAAIVGFPACRRNPNAARTINQDATEMLCRITSEEQRIIFPSTGSVYGQVDGICTEKTEPAPLTIYGSTKLAAEQAVLSTDRAMAFRYATAFGLSPRLRLDLMINDFVYQALNSRNLIVYEKDFRRTFVHVQDIVRSFEFSLQNFDRMKGEVYNLGSESMNYTKEDIAKELRSRIDFYLHFADFGTDPDKRNYAVSYEKVRKLGYEIEIDLDTGLNELITGLGNFSIPNPYSNASLAFQ